MPTLVSYQVTHYIQTEYTTLTLTNNKKSDLKVYYCSTCRYPLLQFKGDLIQELPGCKEVELPIILQCKNPTCGRKYLINAIVKKDET